MAKTAKMDLLTEADLVMARQGATMEYAATLKRLQVIQRVFPGIDAAAKKALVHERMKVARAARRKAS